MRLSLIGVCSVFGLVSLSCTNNNTRMMTGRDLSLVQNTDDAGIADPTGSPKGNGVDDDCNGKVDDGCPCTPGEVARCFLGPPGKRNQGACTDGQMTCIGSREFGQWGDCDGSNSREPTQVTCPAVQAP